MVCTPDAIACPCESLRAGRGNRTEQRILQIGSGTGVPDNV